MSGFELEPLGNAKKNYFHPLSQHSSLKFILKMCYSHTFYDIFRKFS